MAISADNILRVRRMTNEPSQATYTDELIAGIAEDHAFTQNNWPNADTTVYDLHGIAAEIWEEKASVLAQDYDFSDSVGGSFHRSQAFNQAMTQASYHLSRSKARSHKPKKWPREVEVDVTL